MEWEMGRSCRWSGRPRVWLVSYAVRSARCLSVVLYLLLLVESRTTTPEIMIALHWVPTGSGTVSGRRNWLTMSTGAGRAWCIQGTTSSYWTGGWLVSREGRDWKWGGQSQGLEGNKETMPCLNFLIRAGFYWAITIPMPCLCFCLFS